MIKIKKLFIAIVSAAMITAMCVPVMADDGSTSSEITPAAAGSTETATTDTVYGQSVYANDLKICKKTMKIKKVKGLKASIKYPVIKGMKNKTIQRSINASILREAKKQLAYGRKSAGELRKNGYKNVKCETRLTYSVKYNQNGVLSIVINEYQYTGGAHGSMYRLCKNYDLETGKNIRITDIFSNVNGAKTYINSSIRAAIDKSVAAGDVDEITKFKTIKKNDSFYFGTKGITVVFQQNSYFTYASGIQYYALPYSELSAYLDPDYSFLSTEGISLDSSKTNTLAKGQLAYVVLDSNSSTGYIWKCKSSDSKVLKIISQRYISSNADDNISGAGGKEIILVKGISEGNATLQCNYIRDWQGGEEGDSFTYSVEVK
ncbi:PdaC/SigV domain-containing protein [Aminicella lysinilytica]|uniref:Putative secreted protein n=1 Tax=Aminicella lysinilytica TaxID=433323 RepID=A0A4R6PX65_9FIRM|nr:DUF4163 domain-containing protein [Aminicella lysinilytica]NLD11519.1 DUF4163 domain-containing protein [Clostridiales bacterium]TDP44782.1 putative secreted protein [Aminicella lysinilytica]